MLRSISVNSTTADIILVAPDGHSIEKVLEANYLPRNLFQAYLIEPNGDISCIPTTRIVSSFDENQKIIVRCIRNIDFEKVLTKVPITYTTTNPIVTIENVSLNENNFQKTVVELSDLEAQEVVQSKVIAFLKKYSKSSKIVAGISGGGDSNTLVKSIKNSHSKELICFTLIFEEIWDDKATKRASQLCYENGVKHIILTPADIEVKLSMKGSLTNCYKDFSEKFGSNAPEFFATFLVAKVARALCNEYNADEFCCGYNREDVLAELIFSLINGQKPLEFPTRKFGKHTLIMPLWDIPKKLLDACYPKFSFDNYDERIVETTIQRNNIYYISHLLDNIYPNFGQQLMNGLIKVIDKDNWGKLNYDPKFDTFSTNYIQENGVLEMNRILQKYFVEE